MATTPLHLNTRGARRRIATASAALLLLTLSGAATAHAPALDEEELEGRAPTAEEIRPTVEAAFARESYAPHSSATLVVSSRARGITLQLFRVGSEPVRTKGNSQMRGVAVTRPARIGSSSGRRVLRVDVGEWDSGLYFARLIATDGRVGFAPFVVRPSRLGTHRVAVVLPTFTWQAYNLHDDDGDGKGDSWYAAWKKTTARLGRPFLNRGVPYNFRRYDLPFLRWLALTGRKVDYLSDSDLDSAASSGALASAYDLIVFPGHHEYVTKREYDLIEGYRDLGGNLAFLSANNFFWKVVKRGNTIEKIAQWRDLGRPEAALIGVQYRGNDRGTHRAPWIVRSAAGASWLFAGTRLRSGSTFGSGGIEIDQTSPASPPGTQILAEIPNLFGPGFTGQMTYYETPAGAQVFAAGAFTLAGSVWNPGVRRIVENLWKRLANGEQTA
jgi:hypothetical protein